MAAHTFEITAAMVASFVAIHLLIGRIRVIDVTPRSKWLSFSGGVAVSYVFLHMLPELGAYWIEIAHRAKLEAAAAEALIYGLALAGLVTFYGVERQVKLARKHAAGDRPTSSVLWLHIVSYATFNFLIGYLLIEREDESYWGLGLYFGAMALHFVTADYGMRKDHESGYDSWGRWVISAAVLLGWASGTLVSLSPLVVAALFATVAGSVLLNVLKEELPEERQSYFLPFLAGVALYAAPIFIERLAI